MKLFPWNLNSYKKIDFTFLEKCERKAIWLFLTNTFSYMEAYDTASL